VIAAAPATPRLQAGWRLAAGPLSGWRDDDPDALPRCSVDARHVIRNGDRYAIAGIKLACLPCAGIARPPEPPPRPRREPFREERCCERCQRRFVVTSAQKGQRFCSNTCAVATTHERRRQASAAQPTRVVPVEHRRCDLCGEPFPPTATRTRHCSWPCAMRAAAAPADHGETCPCLTCAERRRERELPPLIGARP
jgi:hypothetical protein